MYIPHQKCRVQLNSSPWFFSCFCLEVSSEGVLLKKVVLKNFTIFTEKHPYWSLFLIKIQACECCKIFKNSSFGEHLLKADYVVLLQFLIIIFRVCHQSKSVVSKVKFRQASNRCESVLELANLANVLSLFRNLVLITFGKLQMQF